MPLVRARTFQGFSRYLASRHLSRNTLLICLKPSKLFQIVQYYSTTTNSTHVFQIFSALKTVSGNATCRRSGISVMRRRYLEFPNFFCDWRKSLNFGVFATINLKFFWWSSPRPPAKCNPPFQYPGYVPVNTSFLLSLKLAFFFSTKPRWAKLFSGPLEASGIAMLMAHQLSVGGKKALTSLTVFETKNELRVHNRFARTCNIFRVCGVVMRMPYLSSRKVRWPNSIWLIDSVYKSFMNKFIDNTQ